MRIMPALQNTWTVGNILTIILMAVGVLKAYTEMSSQIHLLNQIVLEYRSDVVDLRSNVAQNESRIRVLELGVGRIEEKLLSINATTNRIEQVITNRRDIP